MAVNGIEIKLGQWWRTADGTEMVVAFKSGAGGKMWPHGWRLDSLSPDRLQNWRWYNESGETPFGDAYKLKELISQARQKGVNGVEIKVGQWWRTADGLDMLVEARDIVRNTWRLQNLDNLFERRYNDFGDCAAHTGQQLLHLLNLEPGLVQKHVINAQYGKTAEPGLYPEETPRTNPKDLIGDKKLALHLLSPIAEAHWAIGQYAGMLKYGAWNWRAAGVRSSVYISAARRHLAAYLSGEEFDPVDGSHHLGNVMACCAILLEAREIGKLTDDRPPCFSHRSTYAWAEDQMAKLKVQYADKAPKHYSIKDAP